MSDNRVDKNIYLYETFQNGIIETFDPRTLFEDKPPSSEYRRNGLSNSMV
jgi:hypothetical protein